MAYRDPLRKLEHDRIYLTLNRKEINKRKRERRALNPDKAREQKRIWAAANREQIKLQTKRWFELNKGKHSEYNRRANYGLSKEQYDCLLRKQNGVCAICLQQNADGSSLSVDHDHRCCKSGKSCTRCIRGLLCNSCNRGIGILKDSPIVLFNALKYIMSHADSA